jgi:hypothetical protein
MRTDSAFIEQKQDANPQASADRDNAPFHEWLVMAVAERHACPSLADKGNVCNAVLYMVTVPTGRDKSSDVTSVGGAGSNYGVELNHGDAERRSSLVGVL